MSPVADYFECGSELSGSVKGRIFLGQLNHCQLLNNNFLHGVKLLPDLRASQFARTKQARPSEESCVIFGVDMDQG